MPSSFLQTPLWLQAEQDLKNQLLSNDQNETKSLSDLSGDLSSESYSSTDADLSEQNIKAAPSLGLVRHFF